MRQKYILARNEEKQRLTISEYTELEKDTFSLICEESHRSDAIRTALARGRDALIVLFRTHNMYPRMQYAEEIARRIIDLYETDQDEMIELLFDDKDAFSRPEEQEAVALDLVKEEAVSADALINGNADDEKPSASNDLEK